MPSLYANRNKAYAEAEQEQEFTPLSKRLLEQNYKFVSQLDKQLKEDVPQTAVVKFNVDKYINLFKNQLQVILNKYGEGLYRESANNTGDLILIWNNMVSYIKAFYSPVANKRDLQKIWEKLAELKPLVSSVLQIADSEDFLDVELVRELYDKFNNLQLVAISEPVKQKEKITEEIMKVGKKRSELFESLEKVQRLLAEMYPKVEQYQAKDRTIYHSALQRLSLRADKILENMYALGKDKLVKKKEFFNEQIENLYNDAQKYNNKFDKYIEGKKPKVEEAPKAETAETAETAEADEYQPKTDEERQFIEEFADTIEALGGEKIKDMTFADMKKVYKKKLGKSRFTARQEKLLEGAEIKFNLIKDEMKAEEAQATPATPQAEPGAGVMDEPAFQDFGNIQIPIGEMNEEAQGEGKPKGLKGGRVVRMNGGLYYVVKKPINKVKPIIEFDDERNDNYKQYY